MSHAVAPRSRVRRTLMLGAVMALSAAFAHADDAPAAQDRLQLAQGLLAFKSIRSAVISPDGQTIAATVATAHFETNKTTVELWLMPFETGEPKVLRTPVTSVDQVLWFPKGDRLAVTGSSASGEHALWTVDGKNGNAKKVATLDRSTHYLAHQGSSLCWSPDGEKLAYLAADAASKKPEVEPRVVKRIQYKSRAGFSDGRRSHLWIADVAQGTSRQITHGDYDVHSIDWSPRGDEIVYCSNQEKDPDQNWNNDLFVLRVMDGKTTKLTNTAGNEMAPAWSPDGSSIAFLMTKRPLTTIDSVAEDAHAWVVERATGKTRELATKLDRRCSALRWNGDGKSVVCLVSDRGNRVLYQLDSSADAAREMFPLEGMVTSYSLSNSGRGCCVLSTPTKPAEIYTFAADGKDLRVRSRFNAGAAESGNWSAPRRVACKSADGTPIESWLMLPPDAKAEKFPLILNIHGGPHSMHGNGFSPTFQACCDRGYAVLYLNPRGSAGYGQKFSDGCVQDWGGGDYKDLMAGLDHVLAQYPQLDPQRLFVTGGSYGGYMTCWIVTQTDRFRAGVSYAGLSNLISFYSTSLYQDLIHVEFGMPWDRFELLWERSPLRHIKNAKTPTLLLHGEADNEVHITQSEEMFTALRRRGIASELVRYPRQGHGASEPRQQVDMLERTLEWFDRHGGNPRRPKAD
jgi:dipeptidyl aminopeptidase/acylaminoacyl peptidase